jgi:methylmalonyl-CoA mutase
MSNPTIELYKPTHKIRIVTAASLFDGHDVAINLMRRLMQRSGAEVIHLGHNRSARDIVETAIEEDAQAIAITSYQGGHTEFFKYVHDLLHEGGAGHIKIFGGGGGTILPEEIRELEEYGITRIYSPDDGRTMGLQGMINDVLSHCDYAAGFSLNGQVASLAVSNTPGIAQVISAIENFPERHTDLIETIRTKAAVMTTPVLGITGTGGAGKSSLVDEFVRRFTTDFDQKSIGIISVDPSKRKSGGALLGDRIRMNAISNERVYMRSLATRQSNLALSQHVQGAIDVLKVAGFDMIILETSGIGQSDTEIVDHSDVSLYVMTPDYGAATQLEKIDMLDFADVVAINKFDKRGAQDALRDVRKQFRRNHELWEVELETLPVFGTIASQFNDPGMNALYNRVIHVLDEKYAGSFNDTTPYAEGDSEKIYIIPPERVRYLSEISENNRKYDAHIEAQARLAGKLYGLQISIETLREQAPDSTATEELGRLFEVLKLDLSGDVWKTLEEWEALKAAYENEEYVYLVRGKEVRVPTTTESLSHTKIPKVILPKFKDWAEIVRWCGQEHVPGRFPYTGGVYPFKRSGEDPTRMFAGEGGPERTNRRFHYVSLDTRTTCSACTRRSKPPPSRSRPGRRIAAAR